MNEFSDIRYGGSNAELFDATSAGREPGGPAVDYLTGLRPLDRALELGVGTGRVAIPLAERGVKVTGIDSSAQMLRELRSKPGGEGVDTREGDLADADAPGDFGLVYTLQSTFFLLRGQEEQRRCLVNAARRLTPGGLLVLEIGSPPYKRMAERQFVDAFDVRSDRAGLFLSEHDPVRQTIDRQEIYFGSAGTRTLPLSYRYVYPSELDLMAALAGLRLLRRDAGWDGGTYNGVGRYVSVYEVDL